MAASKISMKLLVDAKSKKVLFAEAGKDFVDFVFSLLTLPVGAVVKLISAGTMHGSIGRLYQSVDRISDAYLLPSKDKADLLQPRVFHGDAQELRLLLQRGEPEASTLARFKIFTCHGGCATATTERNAACPQCRGAMVTEMAFVMPTGAERPEGATAAGGGEESCGYVKGMVTYMVTDGLEVTPMSAISSITLINRFSVGKAGDVELAEKHVSVGMDEGLALLNAALRSDTVLTDVFLPAKGGASSRT